MYRAWAGSRGMRMREHDRERARLRLPVGGFGARQSLRDERGLHVLDRLFCGWRRDRAWRQA